MSDDEGREGEYFRPDTRTVSTSPDPTLEVEDERVCPMCNAVFPRVIPQESFESHVVSHFEVENGFEVISWSLGGGGGETCVSQRISDGGAFLLMCIVFQTVILNIPGETVIFSLTHWQAVLEVLWFSRVLHDSSDSVMRIIHFWEQD